MESESLKRIEPSELALRPEFSRAPFGSYLSDGNHPATLADYLRVVLKRKWTIVASIVVVGTLVTIMTLRSTPLFEAVGLIAVNKEAGNILGFKEAEASAVGEDWDYTVALETQARILTSDTLAMLVIKNLKLGENPAFAGALSQPETAGLDASSVDPQREAFLLGQFHSALSVNPVPRSRMVEIRFLSPDPRLAAEIVNSLTSIYVEQNFKTKFDSTMQTSDWLSRQLVDLQVKVETAQEKLFRYQKETGILGIDEKQNIVTAKLDELNKELTAAEVDRVHKEARYRLTQSEDLAWVAAIEPNSLLEKLRAMESDLRSQHAQATTQLGPQHPKVVELQNQLQQAESDIRAEAKNIAGRIANDYRTAQSREQMLRQMMEKQKQNANELNEASIQYNLLKRDVETSRSLYEGLLQKLKEAGVSAGLRSSNVRVVDSARVPAFPAKPNVPFNILLGLMLGTVGGVTLVFLLESLDNTVRNPDEIQVVLGVPSLGIIPLNLKPGENGRRRFPLLSRTLPVPSGSNGDDPLEIVSWSKPKSELAESYRALRTSILLSSPGDVPKIILVTSSLPQEGKTTTSVNVAVVLAQRGGRVLLVDADLRRPNIHNIFKLNRHSGLSTTLAGTTTFEESVVPSPQLPNLFVLPSGPLPPQPSELLGSSRMKELLVQWRREFDHIVIDTPPVLSVTDAVTISMEADALIVVVRSEKTTKHTLRRACALLRQVSARITGVVLNAVDLSSPDHYYYYGYGGYRYDHRYYTSDEDKEAEPAGKD